MKEAIQPDGIILTVSKKMYGENGYRHWLRNFREAMDLHKEGWYYSLRVSSKPIRDAELLFVYLCIGNKIRYRGYYGGTQETPRGFKIFEGDRKVKGRFWIRISGPLECASHPIKKQGFRGFRYTEKLF